MEKHEFIVQFIEDDLSDDQKEDLEGELRKIIAEKFGLDDGISFIVQEME